ncbi:fatty acid-binding protein 1-like [Liolophura sinensis]|uniref:fatty acid-binding protein 1-like n=1 Tax=Liolophura sinensis TaxID=3198878 RepID=UPI003159200E
MAAFNGKWKLTKVDNFEAYLDALGVSADLKTKAVSLLTPSNDIFQEINVSGDSITLKSVTPLWTREHTAKFGEAFNEPDLEGKGELTIVINQEGDKLTEQQTGKYTSTTSGRLPEGISSTSVFT